MLLEHCDTEDWSMAVKYVTSLSQESFIYIFYFLFFY